MAEVVAYENVSIVTKEGILKRISVNISKKIFAIFKLLTPLKSWLKMKDSGHTNLFSPGKRDRALSKVCQRRSVYNEREKGKMKILENSKSHR